ncbi:MAG: DUF2505 family protein [Deltaproteobacteria bacterium]|nr:DUF2505 family protein [Deltaproteobacteria bacterium]
MDFTVTQRFACSPAHYWSKTRGAEFDAAVAQEAEVTAQNVEARRDGDRLFERVAIKHITPMTPVAQKAFGKTHLEYTQEIETDDASFSTRWKIVPAFFSDRVVCKGDSVVRGTPQGCERVIRGSIEVRIPLVGGVIERQIGDQIQRSYSRAEPVIRRFVEAG